MHQSQRNKPPYPVRESNSPIGYYQLTRGQLLGFDFFPKKQGVCVCVTLVTWLQKFPKLQNVTGISRTFCLKIKMYVTHVTGISRTFFSDNQNVCHAYHVGHKGPKFQAFYMLRMSRGSHRSKKSKPFICHVCHGDLETIFFRKSKLFLKIKMYVTHATWVTWVNWVQKS